MSDAEQPTALTQAVSAQLKTLLEQDPSPKVLNQAYRLLAKWRAQLIENTLVRNQGPHIAGGPFAGMHYPLPATEGGRVPRLMGSYETSLIPVIETIIKRGYGQIIDIGCAEGYYAVGLARRLDQAKILARDACPKAQKACRELAMLNGVAERVHIGGAWCHEDFTICAKADTMVICDIEGAEAALLDPAKAPGLRSADILVEVHECFSPGLCQEIAARFTSSHRITKLERQLNSEALPNWMDKLSDLDRLTALWEWRSGPTPWLWMERLNACA
ncbi:MAG: class I SAM-dependent methyltransferase [Mangrovicoccus sp.]|nr:class I SAM-dependent methyltransferase [Mangrovicoccus sp.]